jgi:hypothetical protein
MKVFAFNFKIYFIPQVIVNISAHMFYKRYFEFKLSEIH